MIDLIHHILQDKIKYSIVGDDTAMRFFYIDADTGVISLKSSIVDDTSTRYMVCVPLSCLNISLSLILFSSYLISS